MLLYFCFQSRLYKALPGSQNPLCTLKTCLDLPGPGFRATICQPTDAGHCSEQCDRLWCCSAQSSESKHDFLREAFWDSSPSALLSLEQISPIQSAFFQSPHQFCNCICKSPLLSKITSFTIIVPMSGNIRYTMFNKY